MLVVALALEGLMEVTLAPALSQVVEQELELDLAVELALALALELEGALEMVLQQEKETVTQVSLLLCLSKTGKTPLALRAPSL